MTESANAVDLIVTDAAPVVSADRQAEEVSVGWVAADDGGGWDRVAGLRWAAERVQGIH